MPEEEGYALIAKGISKRFISGNSYVDALQGIDLKVKKGELLMIVGPSGCGKTTLLSTLAGTLSFDSGELYVYGQSLKDMNRQQITAFRRKNIGFIFQQYHLIQSINVAENVCIPLLLNGISKKIALKRACALLEQVGLKGKASAKPMHLSGGEQQRVAIARALIHEPLMVICDEPTAALDAESGTRIMRLLIGVARSPKRCVVVVTHDNRIFKYADSVICMEDGIIISTL